MKYDYSFAISTSLLAHNPILFKIMDTPPNTGPHRLNYMHFRRGGEEEDPARHELLTKFGPSIFPSMQNITSTRKKLCQCWLSGKT